MKQLLKVVGLGILLILSVIAPHLMSAAAAGASPADWAALEKAFKSGDADTVQVLVPAIISVNAVSPRGHTPLAMAEHEAKRHHHKIEYVMNVSYIESLKPARAAASQMAQPARRPSVVARRPSLVAGYAVAGGAVAAAPYCPQAAGGGSAGACRATGAQWNQLTAALKAGDRYTVEQLVPYPIEPWRRTEPKQAGKIGHTPLEMARHEAREHHNAGNYIDVVIYLEQLERGGGAAAGAAAGGGGPAGGGFARRGSVVVGGGGYAAPAPRGGGYVAPGLSADEQKIVAAGRPIEFYDKGQSFYWLTNFGEIPGGMFVDGFSWPTTEHYFQAKKFTDPKIVSAVNRAATPGDVYRLANSTNGQYKANIRANWYQALPKPFGGGSGTLAETFADAVMMRALVEKFKNPVLGAKLLATKNLDLIEASPKDPYWGWGPQRNGKNKLGRMLGYVRWAIENGKIGQVEAELKQRGF